MNKSPAALTPFERSLVALTPQGQERLVTEAARISLPVYARLQWPSYKLGQHLLVMAAALERLERGEIDRLLIQMPPRHGKSMMASQFFPAWYLGRNPDHYVITATYGQDLADDFGRLVRDQLADPLFDRVFPGVGLAPGGRAASRFVVTETGQEGGYEHHLSRSGAYYAVGVGGPVTGRGAHLLLIDDPIKNREEADSEITRAKLQSWYTSTAYTRLMPGGRVCVVQTRWVEDDLSGWLEAEHEHEGWTVIRMPAIADEPSDPLGRAIGEPLWPEQYDLAGLARIQRALPARDWSALYQQKPAPDEGLLFQASWFMERDPVPIVRVFGASDFATSEKETADYTVHLVMGMDANGLFWILDVWRRQAMSDVAVESWADMVLNHKPVLWGMEQGVIDNVLKPLIETVVRRRQVQTVIRRMPSKVDKVQRAQTILGYAATHGVRIPRGAPWWPALLAELLAFNAGKHDDQVDALSLAGRLMPYMEGAVVDQGPRPGAAQVPPAGSIPASALLPDQRRPGPKRIQI
jgi:predicted phage terminase large subunit-like protein